MIVNFVFGGVRFANLFSVFALHCLSSFCALFPMIQHYMEKYNVTFLQMTKNIIGY